MQGIRSLRIINQRLVNQLLADGHNLQGGQDQDAWHLAQNPFAFINILSDNLAEFSQRVFYEVARENVDNILDIDEATNTLRQAIKDLLSNQLEELTNNREVECFLEVAAGVLALSDTFKDRRMAVVAYIDLLILAVNRYDYRTASQIGLKILEGIEREEVWSAEDPIFKQLLPVFGVFWQMRWLDEARKINNIILGPTFHSGETRELSSVFKQMGDVYTEMRAVEYSSEAYRRSLDIDLKLVEDSQSLENRLNLTYSYNGIASVHHLTAIKKMGDVNSIYLENQIVDLELLRGVEEELLAALHLHEDSLSECQRLHDELPEDKRTIKLKYDLNICYGRVGDVCLDMHRFKAYIDKLGPVFEDFFRVTADTNKLNAALENYDQSFKICESLFKVLQTPESKRSLRLACNKLGNAYFAKGNKYDALDQYEKGFNYAKEQYDLMKTSLSARELCISCYLCAQVYEELGRYSKSCEVLGEGLSFADHYRELAPNIDSESLTSLFRRELERLCP